MLPSFASHFCLNFSSIRTDGEPRCSCHPLCAEPSFSCPWNPSTVEKHLFTLLFTILIWLIRNGCIFSQLLPVEGYTAVPPYLKSSLLWVMGRSLHREVGCCFHLRKKTSLLMQCPVPMWSTLQCFWYPGADHPRDGLDMISHRPITRAALSFLSCTRSDFEIFV